MVPERCQNRPNPSGLCVPARQVKTREGKRGTRLQKEKPVVPENDLRETGCLFLNGGGAGSRTRVRKYSPLVSTCLVPG